MHKRFVIVSLVLATLGTANDARPHIFLDHASPLVGSTVAAASREVSLSFTQSLEPAFSRVEVSDSTSAAAKRKRRSIYAGASSF